MISNLKTPERITVKQPAMIFDQFDPREDKILRIIDNEGEVINKELMPTWMMKPSSKRIRRCCMPG